MKRITLDTNVLPANDILSMCQELGWELAVVTVTERELADTSFQVQLDSLNEVQETGVWDESAWGNFVWGEEETAQTLEKILQIISNGSFPTNRENLASGFRRQLRDAMIFESHVNAKRDIFVTKDERAFIRDGRREQLELQFKTQVRLREEFVKLCQDNLQRSNTGGTA